MYKTSAVVVIVIHVPCTIADRLLLTRWLQRYHHHHHIRLLEVVKRNRQHTVQKIDVGIYMDIHTIHTG